MGASFTNWISESRNRISREGTRGLIKSLYFVYVGGLLSFSSRFPIGTNIFERDWDLLIILDACRVDALREVKDEYEFLADISTITSVGSATPEWMAHTFTTEYRNEISKTGYISANPQFEKVFRQRLKLPTNKATPFGPPFDTYNVLKPEDFGHLDLVYEYASDDEYGVVFPRKVTDRAIETGRDQNFERQIVHYMQPHQPHIGSDNPSKNVFDDIRAGSVSRTDAWEMYLDTLRLVLNDVSILLENIDADNVVITADHGEAFGEFTFHSHNIACPHPVVRRVPWVRTTADDGENYAPDTEFHDVDAEIETQLKKLGYR